MSSRFDVKNDVGNGWCDEDEDDDFAEVRRDRSDSDWEENILDRRYIADFEVNWLTRFVMLVPGLTTWGSLAFTVLSPFFFPGVGLLVATLYLSWQLSTAVPVSACHALAAFKTRAHQRAHQLNMDARVAASGSSDEARRVDRSASESSRRRAAIDGCAGGMDPSHAGSRTVKSTLGSRKFHYLGTSQHT